MDVDFLQSNQSDLTVAATTSSTTFGDKSLQGLGFWSCVDEPWSMVNPRVSGVPHDQPWAWEGHTQCHDQIVGGTLSADPGDLQGGEERISPHMNSLSKNPCQIPGISGNYHPATSQSRFDADIEGLDNSGLTA